MIITSLYTNIAASFKSSYNGRVIAVLTIWHFTKWLGTPQRMQSDLANTVPTQRPCPTAGPTSPAVGDTTEPNPQVTL